MFRPTCNFFNLKSKQPSSMPRVVQGMWCLSNLLYGILASHLLYGILMSHLLYGILTSHLLYKILVAHFLNNKILVSHLLYMILTSHFFIWDPHISSFIWDPRGLSFYLGSLHVIFYIGSSRLNFYMGSSYLMFYLGSSHLIFYIGPSPLHFTFYMEFSFFLWSFTTVRFFPWGERLDCRLSPGEGDWIAYGEIQVSDSVPQTNKKVDCMPHSGRSSEPQLLLADCGILGS